MIKNLSLKFFFPLTCLVMLVLALSIRLFNVAPLGELLNPFTGMVQNEQPNTFDQEHFTEGVHADVYFDERHVPHIFSNKSNDLYYVQGYVTAAHRLWQMDFLSYVSAGRLAEIMGQDYIDYDRNQRRIGMLQSAKVALSLMEDNELTISVLNAYTKGVNDYIESLDPLSYPLEYKLLGYSPEPWTNLKSVLIMKYMSAMLSGYEEDIKSSWTYNMLGESDFQSLFSDYKVEHAENAPFFSVTQFQDSMIAENQVDFSFLQGLPIAEHGDYNPSLGSNAWAISAEKTETGNAILCNDPHLNLSFPTIWFENQLVSNDMNVYGYSIPGTPGVIIGFNRDISWGITNGATDTKDWYKPKINYSNATYFVDGDWEEMDTVIEVIKVNDDRTIYDTVFWTCHGPIVFDNKFGDEENEAKHLSLRWAMHDPSNEFQAFLDLNKASNYQEFNLALENYKCPIQNFLYADVNGNVGMIHQGALLNGLSKSKGVFIQDGTISPSAGSSKDYSGLNSWNPEQGFVFSANNTPFSSDSVFTHGYYSDFRALGISRRLAEEKTTSIDDQKQLQVDNTNHLAKLAIPVLLNLIGEHKNSWLDRLETWDCQYQKDSDLALLFEEWWRNIEALTWDELNKYEQPLLKPTKITCLNLLANDPENKYFDLLSTPEIETASDIVVMAFLSIPNGFGATYFARWKDFNQVTFSHLSFLTGLGIEKIEMDGHPHAINATSPAWGPSLRLIVEMDKERPVAYGVMPGGQSGNVAFKHHNSQIEEWSKGNYFKLKFFIDSEEAKLNSKYQWNFQKK